MPTPQSDLWRVENSKLVVSMHPGQLETWDSEARFTFAVAGTQGGKTSFGPLWLWREYKRQGPGDYLAVTATFPLLQLKMLPEFLRFWDRTLNLGEWQASNRVFQLRDETRIIFGSATRPESLESATAKAAWMDECGQDTFRQESWEAVQRRLALSQGRVLGTSTPYNLGWMKQQVYDRWRDGDPDYRVVSFPSTANPRFPQAEYERAKRTLPAWKLAMFYEGVFTKPAGLIFDAYNDEYRELGGHKVHPFDIPLDWKHYVGLDFGGVNTAKLYAAQDPETGNLFIYRADLSGGKTSQEHATEITHNLEGRNYVSAWGGSKSEDQQRRDFQLGPLVVRGPIVVDVEAGIDRVYGRFKTDRLFIFDSCLGLRDELGTYRREVGPDGEPAEKIADKNTFHRIDSLRYLVCGIDGPTKTWGLA